MSIQHQRFWLHPFKLSPLILSPCVAAQGLHSDTGLRAEQPASGEGGLGSCNTEGGSVPSQAVGGWEERRCGPRRPIYTEQGPFICFTSKRNSTLIFTFCANCRRPESTVLRGSGRSGGVIRTSVYFRQWPPRG